MILAKFYPKFLPKGKLWVSQVHRTGFFFFFFYTLRALNLHQKIFTKLHNSSFQNTTFSSFWGGTSPLRHPLWVQGAFGTEILQKIITKKVKRRIYAPG